MTETLFERYKEALRAGHVAVVRGSFEEAAAAYGEAILLAPDRSVPRTALGSVHLRLGDPHAALASYDAALAIAPDDDAALLGRAQALVVLRRTADAAATYDRLADVDAAAGRTATAVEAARRAVAIEPTDVRRARHADFVGRLRAPVGAGDGATELTATGAADAADLADADAALPGPDPEALVVAAEEAVARGDGAGAAAAALAAARGYRAQGHVAAAFDACQVGIGARPSDVDLHMLLADLAVGQGWTSQAGDAYRNLVRLVELDGDAPLAESIRAAAAARLPGDTRFSPG